jgi:hypothetical protein
MRNLTSQLATFSLVFLFTACGSSSFSGDSVQRIERAENGKTNTGIDNSSDLNDKNKSQDDIIDSSIKDKGDADAIKKCLAKWGNHPFNENDFSEYRKISASVQVLGIGNPIIDKEVTPAPKLIVVSAAVNVLGEATYDLLNPNGWYCLKVDVNVKSKTNINLACKAKIADSKVNVNVLGNADAAGAVGVHVMSDVKVIRAKGC